MGKKLDKITGTTWSIKHEGHLNPNNIIFKDDKYKELYQEIKKYNDYIKKKRKNENTNSL
tara:strand:+ start:79 stop:258 length:180 start_codon:yes stop_codon:yes gene_type:complete